MKTKKKLNDANQKIILDLNLPATAESEMVIQLYKELTKVSTLSEKCSAVDDVGKRLCENSDDDLILVGQLLFSSLLQLESRSPLRKNIFESLEKICARISKEYYSLVYDIIITTSNSPKESKVILNQLVLFTEKKNLVIEPELTECDRPHLPSINDTWLFILEEAVKHIQYIWSSATNLETSTAETNYLFQVAHQIIKNLTIIHHENVENRQEKLAVLWDVTLFESVLKISTADITPLDLRTSCGLFLTQIQIAKEKDFVIVFNKIFNKEIPFNSVEDMGHMALFHGLLCHANDTQLFNQMSSDVDDVATKMLKRIFHIINTAQFGTVAILGSRLLNQLMIKLREHIAEKIDATDKSLFHRYSIYSENSRKIMDTIWLLWDHFLDCVKHLARDTFIAFIKVQELINNDLAISYFKKLSCSLVNSLPNKQSFSALTCLSSVVGVSFLVQSNSNVIISLMKQLSDPSFSAQAANLLEALFSTHVSECMYDEWHQFWFGTFFDNFTQDTLVYGFESLLEKLFLESKEMMKPITTLSESINMSDNQLCLLLMCTKIYLKHLKIENKLEDKICDNLWKNILPFHHLIHALDSGGETLCILAFNLISDSKKSTELFDQRELQAVLRVLKRNIASPNSSFRQKLVTSIRKILNRIHYGMNFKNKYSVCTSENSELLQIKKIHEEFILKLFKFLESNLFIGSNFPRRSTSLLILECVLHLLQEKLPFSHLKPELLTREFNDTLLLCLTDSYEANKQMALNILLLINNETSEIKGMESNEAVLESVWLLASSPKPPDSLTASYILNFTVNSSLKLSINKEIPNILCENRRLAICWTVLLKIKSELKIAQASLLKASSSGPMYGLLLCLRKLFADLKPNDLLNIKSLWAALIKETIQTCHSIVDVVADIVRNSSPEGHLPMDYTTSSEIFKEAVSSSIAAQENNFNGNQADYSESELVKAQAVSSQMLLLCGWRSIKEIALLFGFFIQGSSAVLDVLSLLSVEDVKSIGDFYLVQLTETKHRGAFEQSYTGFQMVCSKLWQCLDKELVKLPEHWLKNILNIIQVENDTKLCATRRSAGVPFIIQAIISCEPSIRGGSCLRSTMEFLLQLADSEDNSEARIHALNILRTLYKDTRLGEAVIPYVSAGVKVAVNGYSSKSWSLRNSSSLMFAAIVTRMLGVKKAQEDLHAKNSVSALVFFRRYPDLYDFFIEKMSMNVADMKKGNLSVSIFPTFLILARLAPASSDGYSTSIPLAPFVPYVLELCGSPVYKLRSLASRALIPLVSPPTLISVTERLCSFLCLENQNLMHGSLLSLGQILKSFSKIIISSEEIKNKLMSLFSRSLWVAYETNTCQFTRACGIELFQYIVKINIFPSLNIKSLTASCFSLILNSRRDQVHIPGADMVVKAAADFFLTVNKKHNKENVEPFLHLLNFPSLDIQQIVLNHCLSMKSFSHPLILKLFTEIKTESDSEFWKLKVDLLSRIFSTSKQEEFFVYAEDLDDLLLLLHQRLNLERRDDNVAAAIKLSGIILPFKLKFCKVLESNFVLSWIDSMVKYSDTNYAPDIRLAVTEAVGHLLCELQEASVLKAELEVPILEILVRSLVDDDEELRAIANSYSSLFLKKFSSVDEEFKNFMKKTLTPSSIVVEKIFYYLASKNNDVHFTSLLIQALKEDLPQEFGLSQEEDRAFDKGETQILNENITICLMAASSIEKSLQINGDEYINSRTFRIVMLTDHLLLPIPNSEENICCTVKEFLTILKRELEYILDVFSHLKKISPFEMKSFDIWLERLARRAYVWNVLKKFGIENFDRLLLDNLECSLVKPTIFASILECLS